MYKSNYLKRNEDLIEIRKQLRRLSGLVESIEESLRLWKKTDKMDEHWDVFWSYGDDQGKMEVCSARIRAAFMAVEYLLLIVYRRDNSLADKLPENVKFIQSDYFSRDLASIRSTKEKISRLQGTAKDCREMVNQMLDDQWSQWIRKDSRLSFKLVHEARIQLTRLTSEIEGYWFRISSGPILGLTADRDMSEEHPGNRQSLN